MRIALFKSAVDPEFTIIKRQEAEKWTDMVRISDYLEVEFPPRTDTAEAIAAQAEKLDQEIARAEDRHQKRMAALRETKTAVLSLAFRPEVAA